MFPQIPLTVDMAIWLGLGAPEGTRMESVIGFLDVAQDGTVTYNGKAISDQVKKACSSVHLDTDKPLATPQNPPPVAVE